MENGKPQARVSAPESYFILFPEEFRLLPHHNTRLSLPFRVEQANAKNVFPIFEEFDLQVRIAVLAVVINGETAQGCSPCCWRPSQHLKASDSTIPASANPAQAEVLP